MPTNSTTFDPAGQADSLRDTASGMASQMKDKVASVGRTAAQKIDANRQSAASGLERVANTLHQKADKLPGGEKVSGLAHSTARKLGVTADYVRQHDVSSMTSDAERVIRKNPGASLAGAAVVGFLVGRALRRSS